MHLLFAWLESGPLLVNIHRAHWCTAHAQFAKQLCRLICYGCWRKLKDICSQRNLSKTPTQVAVWISAPFARQNRLLHVFVCAAKNMVKESEGRWDVPGGGWSCQSFGQHSGVWQFWICPGCSRKAVWRAAAAENGSFWMERRNVSFLPSALCTVLCSAGLQKEETLHLSPPFQSDSEKNRISTL